MRIDFNVDPFEDEPDCHVVMPAIDGVSLAELVEEFERRQEFEPSGRIRRPCPGALSLRTRFGALRWGGRHVCRNGRVPLLGCSCGEWGCWPLLARITATDEHVTWSDFRQPNRPDRDYSAFGSFVFDRGDYFDAVDAISADWNKKL